MRHENTRALFDYWNALRNNRTAPYRSEVDPREIAPLLDSIFILEFQSPENIRFRLAGTRLCENFGMELRGMSALSLWHGDCRTKVRDILNRVVVEPCIGHVSCTVENRGGFLYEAEFLYMPLRSDVGELTRILGCGYYMGEEQAFANLYEPIHHWVDRACLYEIDCDPAADPAEPPKLSSRISDLRKATGVFGGDTHAGILRAIEGGLSQAAPKRRKNDRRDGDAPKRTHLRLVKPDAS